MRSYYHKTANVRLFFRTHDNSLFRIVSMTLDDPGHSSANARLTIFDAI
jgi:hypothetical protein